MQKHSNFYIHTYGCQMNVYDSAVIRSLLKREGFNEVENEKDADVIIYNTCSVREHAEKRAFGRILTIRGKYPDKKVVVVGCMAERLKQELKEDYGFRYVLGPREYRNLPNFLRGRGETEKISPLYDDIFPEQEGVSAYVSIIRGCNRFCSYCIVPYLRKEEVSRKPENIIDEVNKLVERGIKEVILLGHNVNRYRYGDLDFPEILRLVAKDTDILRLNFLTSHPADISRKLFEVMASFKNITHFLHLPVQSGSDKVLEMMRRGYKVEDYLRIIKEAREIVPDITITTDIIVGYPGEEEDDFRKTLELVEEVEFDYAFMFRYSPRKGTLAALVPERLTDEQKKERLSRLIDIQNRITLKKNKALIGKERELLVFGRAKKDGNIGKDITGKMIVFEGAVPRGEIVKVKITEVSGWTPKGSIIEK